MCKWDQNALIKDNTHAIQWHSGFSSDGKPITTVDTVHVSDGFTIYSVSVSKNIGSCYLNPGHLLACRRNPASISSQHPCFLHNNLERMDQDLFDLQTSLLQQKLETKGHKCIFLPKFHCKLNPIEMVYSFNLNHFHILANHCTQYWGWSKQHFRDVPKNWFDVAKRVAHESLDACPVGVIWTDLGSSWTPIIPVWLEKWWSGPSTNRNPTVGSVNRQSCRYMPL